MNLDQIQSLIRTLLAAGGPIAALLVQYGMPQDKVSIWISIALVVLPPVVAAVWGIITKTDAAKVAAVGAMPGVSVIVAPSASAGAQAAAADKAVPGVNPVPNLPLKT
jgi:hypothetical protein